MPLKIDFGEIAERLRRFFRQTGRLPLRADESVIPVAVVQDVSIDPFRGDPRTWSTFVFKPAVAAIQGVVGLVAAPATLTFGGELLVVDTAVEDCLTAVQTANLFLSRQQASVVSGLVGFVRGASGLVLNTPGGVTTGGQVLQSFAFSANASPGVKQSAWEGTAAAATLLVYPGPPIVLFPGDVLMWISGVANQPIEASFTGRAFDPSFLSR